MNYQERIDDFRRWRSGLAGVEGTSHADHAHVDAIAYRAVEAFALQLEGVTVIYPVSWSTNQIHIKFKCGLTMSVISGNGVGNAIFTEEQWNPPLSDEQKSGLNFNYNRRHEGMADDVEEFISDIQTISTWESF